MNPEYVTIILSYFIAGALYQGIGFGGIQNCIGIVANDHVTMSKMKHYFGTH